MDFVQNNNDGGNMQSQQPVVKQKRGCLKGCLVLMVEVLAGLLVLVIIVTLLVSKNVDKNGLSSTEEKEGIAIQYMDISKEEGERIDEILVNCGLTNITAFQRDSLLDNVHSEGEMGFRLVEGGNLDKIILYINPDKTVYSLSYNTYMLYENGEVLATIDDYTMTAKERDEYIILCQEKVKEILKAPATAKFPNYTEWGYCREKNIVTMQGYVDSQNGFGAMVRSQFQLKINTDTNSLDSFIFDGQELIQQ